LNRGIQTNQYLIVKELTDLGIKPSITDTCDNSLTCAAMQGDPKIVNLILEMGGEPDSSQTVTNTLSCVAEQCMENEDLDLSVLRFIHTNGGVFDSSQSSTNTVTRILRCILCKGLRQERISDHTISRANQALELVHELGGKPDIFNDGSMCIAIRLGFTSGFTKMIESVSGLQNQVPIGYNALKEAIDTKNLEIVRIICRHPGSFKIPDDKLLLSAVLTFDPEIVQEIIVHALYETNFRTGTIINELCVMTRYRWIFQKNQKANYRKMINLLLCIGHQLPHDVNDADQPCRYQLLDYMELLVFHAKTDRADQLKKELIELTKELKRFDFPEQEFIIEFDQGTNKMFCSIDSISPWVCFEKINDSHDRLVRILRLMFQDWSKYD
jgi:hypothetical protein